jgi:hypothetical protein
MVKLWFSYSFPQGMTLDSHEPNSSPYHHTWNSGNALRNKAKEMGWDFEYVNLDDTTPRTIGKDDIVIGHPWFNSQDSFIQQAFRQECKAKIVLQPYTELMVGEEQLEILDRIWEQADWLFLNTGQFWFDGMPKTRYAKFQQKATRLDNTVNPILHPFSKRKWNKQGERTFLCIGYDSMIKGLDAVAELARVTGIKLLHCGSTRAVFWQHVPRVHSIGGMAFTPENIQWVCDNFDAFLTMGRFDANPTALAETACWGLLGCCTPESGYYADEPFVGLKHGDMAHNMEVIDWIQRASVSELETRVQRIRESVIESHSIPKRKEIIWAKVLELIA